MAGVWPPSAKMGIRYIYAVSGAVVVLVLIMFLTVSPSPPSIDSVVRKAYRTKVGTILRAAESQLEMTPWTRLAHMSDEFGSRLSGAPGLTAAIEWVASEMAADGFDNVTVQPVQVPVWVRSSTESAVLVSASPPAPLSILALGGSVPTPGPGLPLVAPVVVVGSFGELEERGLAGELAGKIVVIDAAFVSYSDNYQYRAHGASQAAKHGAVAMLVRSLTPYSIASPHTGGMRYDDSVPKIPAAALSTEDADMLRRMQSRGDALQISLALNCSTGEPAASANVIGELRGTSAPHEVVLLGAHIDAWDVGRGAMDDGGGIMAIWHAVTLLKSLGLRPRRTIRVVCFTNEENGLAGGLAYRASLSDAELANHVLAIESDSGTFEPEGFYAAGGSQSTTEFLTAVSRILRADPIDARKLVRAGETGADISPLAQAGVPTLELIADGGVYFRYHHTRADTPLVVDPTELNRCVGVLAAMAYVIADLEQALPR